MQMPEWLTGASDAVRKHKSFFRRSLVLSKAMKDFVSDFRKQYPVGTTVHCAIDGSVFEGKISKTQVSDAEFVSFGFLVDIDIESVTESLEWRRMPKDTNSFHVLWSELVSKGIEEVPQR